MDIDIYYSYACRESYLVFAWLKQVQKSGRALNLQWHPFAIQIDGDDKYWQRSWETATSELRGFIAAEAARRQGQEAFERFHEALEQAVHEQILELRDETTLIGAARRAGLDLARFQADWLDPQLAQTAQGSHNKAMQRWNIFGTPTLIFPNDAAYHLELSEVPSSTAALEMFRAIETLTGSPAAIRQLRRTN